MTPPGRLWENILIVLAVAAVYAAGLGGDPVFDDPMGVQNHARLRDGGRLLKYAWDPADVNPVGGALPTYAYRPLTEATFWLNRQATGEAFWAMRATNLLIHTWAACLVLALLRRFGRMLDLAWSWLPLCGALWFAVHPMGVQAVDYVYQRSVSLGALLSFAALLGYLKARDGEGHLGWPLVWAFLAMGAKESCLTLPLTLLCVEVVLRRPGESRRSVLSRWLPFVLVAALVPLQVSRALRSGWLDSLQSDFLGRGQYLLVQGRALWDYARLHLLPFHLHFYHEVPHPLPSWPIGALPPAALAAVIGWVLWGPARQAWVRLGAGLMLAPQALESSVFPLRDLIFHHRCYPGLLGGALVFGGLVASLPGRRFLGAGALGLLAVITVHESRIWSRSGEMLLRDLRAAPRVPKHWAAWAEGQAGHGHLETADRGFRRAFRCGNCNVHPWVSFARNLEALGQREQAFKVLESAMNQSPGQAVALLAAVELALKAGETDRVRTLAPRVAGLACQPPAVGGNLGHLLIQAGCFSEAATVLKLTLSNAPDVSDLWYNLGVALDRLGEKSGAEAALNRSLTLPGAPPEAHNNLGGLLGARGDLEGAEREFRAAVRSRPDYRLAWANLAAVLDGLGRPDEARDARDRAGAGATEGKVPVSP